MPLPYLDPSVTAALGAGGMDAARLVIDNTTKIVLLSAEAASYAEADTNLGSGSGKKIAEIAVVAGDFSVSGTGIARKVTFAGKTGGSVPIAGPADPAVVAFLDGATILVQLAETSAATFISGGTITIPALDVLAFGPLA